MEIAESEGLDATIEQLVLDALDRHPDIGAVYSIGGGNVATIRAFEQRGRNYRVFIARDLDEDNRMLLRTRKISAVLHQPADRRQYRRADDPSGAWRDEPSHRL